MRKNRAIVVVAATGLALLGTACSADKGSGDPTQQSPTPDPCQLLTLDEVSTFLGATVAVSREMPGGSQYGERHCPFIASTDGGGMVSVTVWPFDGKTLDAFKAQQGTVTDIAGVGEGAFERPPNIWVYQGGWMIKINILGGQVASIDQMATLAKAAVGRLPA